MRHRKPYAHGIIILMTLFIMVPKGYAEWVYVERVIDGDTFVITDGTVVRVKGVDTPETKHPTKGEEPGGQAATELAKLYLENNRVWLGGYKIDRYGRRVAVVQLSGGKYYADIVREHGLDKLTADGTGYHHLLAPLPNITWVEGYTRSDGTYVKGHWKYKSKELVELTKHTLSDPYTKPVQVTHDVANETHNTPTYSTSYSATYGGGSSSSPYGTRTVFVNGYYRSDGTYVRSHYRSPPGMGRGRK